MAWDEPHHISSEARDAAMIAAHLALPRENQRKLLAFFYLASSRRDISADVLIEADRAVEVRLRYREQGVCDAVEDVAQPQSPPSRTSGKARSCELRTVNFSSSQGRRANLGVQRC